MKIGTFSRKFLEDIANNDPSITEINFHGKKISNEEAIAIADAILMNDTIQEVYGFEDFHSSIFIFML